MQTSDEREIDIEGRDGRWYFRYRSHHMGPYGSYEHAIQAGKKYLYILYLRRMRVAALERLHQKNGLYGTIDTPRGPARTRPALSAPQ